MLAFAGWRKQEIYDHGNVSLWVKDGIPPARPTSFGARPSAFQGILWGTLPIGSSLLALILIIFLRDRRRLAETLQFPSMRETEPEFKEAR